MRKAFKIVGIILLFMLLIGTLFKIMNWPGSSIFLILGTSINAMYVFAVSIAYGIKHKVWLESISFAIGMMILLIGYLFQLFMWPGGLVMCLVSLPFLLVSIISIILKKEDVRFNGGTLSFLVAGVILINLFLGVSANRKKLLPSTYETINHLRKLGESMEPNSKAVQKDVKLIDDFIDEIILQSAFYPESVSENNYHRLYAIDEVYYVLELKKDDYDSIVNFISKYELRDSDYESFITPYEGDKLTLGDLLSELYLMKIEIMIKSNDE